MKKRFLTVLSFVLVIFMVFSGCSAAKTNTDSPSDADILTSGQTTQAQTEKEMHNVFGNFTTETLEGEKVDQSIFEGKITMVSIWAVVSEYSVNQLADLEKISRKYAEDGFQVVGVASNVYMNPDGSLSQDGVEQAQKAAKDVSFVNILPNEELNAAKLDSAKYIPETFFLDGDGNVIGESFIGSKNYEDWCSIVDGVLKGE